MTSEEKKAFLLLKSVIFHYHGLDEDEQQLLDDAAMSMEAREELAWATEFIGEDYYTAFDRARTYLSEVMNQFPKEKRLTYLLTAWDANNKKGYISEMEAMAMLKLAKDWGVEAALIAKVRG
jgi:hypothetical protein